MRFSGVEFDYGYIAGQSVLEKWPIEDYLREFQDYERADCVEKLGIEPISARFFAAEAR